MASSASSPTTRGWTGYPLPGCGSATSKAFDAIRIDCLNGDKYKTGKTTPDGRPDPSIFSTPGDPVGIQVGTAIATLVRKSDHAPAESVDFRHLWGQVKLTDLTDTAETEPAALYETVEPVLPLGLPFANIVVNQGWHEWPSLPELFPVSFPGVTTNRDSFLVEIDLDKLKTRIDDYFDVALSHDEIARRYPVAMKNTSSISADPISVREDRLARGRPDEEGYLRYAHRPFDIRWIYWESDSGLLARPSPAFRPHVFSGNIFLEARQRESVEEFLRGTPVRQLAGDFGNGRSHFFPAWLRHDGLALDGDGAQRRPNLSAEAQRYLDRLGLGVEDLFHHALAVLHDPAYRAANAGALRMEWPRIPLPGWAGGRQMIDAPNAADELRASAQRGRELAALLDPETPVPGVTAGTLRPELAAIAVPSTADGRNMTGDDFALTAGWGHFGTGDAVMPGQGRAVERAYTAAEREALGDAVGVLGDATVRRVPERQRLLAQRPRSSVELQAGRLPGAEEVALVPGKQSPGPKPVAGRGAALHRHGAADRGGAGADRWRVGGEFQAHPGAPSFWPQPVILSEAKNPSTGAEALRSSQATG